MRIDAPITSATNPYHIARAYGLNTAARTHQQAPATGPQRVQEQQAAVTPSNAQRLVAAVVPGRVDFSGAQAQPSSGTLPMYRHPADRNAAATGVVLGKSLDITG